MFLGLFCPQEWPGRLKKKNGTWLILWWLTDLVTTSPSVGLQLNVTFISEYNVGEVVTPMLPGKLLPLLLVNVTYELAIRANPNVHPSDVLQRSTVRRWRRYPCCNSKMCNWLAVVLSSFLICFSTILFTSSEITVFLPLPARRAMVPKGKRN